MTSKEFRTFFTVWTGAELTEQQMEYVEFLGNQLGMDFIMAKAEQIVKFVKDKYK